MSLFHPKSGIRFDTISVGARAEAFIIARFMAVGYNVLKPISAALRYDLVIEDADGQFWRVQCKSGRYKKGSVEWNSMSFGTSVRRPYTGQADYFAIYCSDLGKVYLVSVDSTKEGHGHLRIDPLNKYADYHKIRWAKDYEL